MPGVAQDTAMLAATVFALAVAAVAIIGLVVLLITATAVSIRERRLRVQHERSLQQWTQWARSAAPCSKHCPIHEVQ